jgi:hypothetical protein
MAEGAFEEAVYLIVHRKQRKTGGDGEPGTTFKGTPPVTCFFQVGPMQSFHYLLK